MVKNFRSLEDAKIDGLKNTNVFVGSNNSGKSSVLEVLKLAANACKENPFTIRGGFGQIVFGHDINRTIKVTLQISLSRPEREQLVKDVFARKTSKLEKAQASRLLSRLTYSFEYGNNERLVIESLKCSDFDDSDIVLVSRNTQNGQWVGKSLDLEGSCSKLGADAMKLGQPGLEDRERVSPPPDRILQITFSPYPREYELMQRIRDYILQWHWLNPARVSSVSLSAQEQMELSPDGGNLPAVLNTINSNDPDLIVRIKDEVHRIIPDVTKVLAPLRREQTTVLTVEEHGDVRFNPMHMSFGIQQTIILVTRLLTMKTGSILILEEPENHLHARSQRRLLDLLRERSKGIQVFLTTHSCVLTGCSDDIQTYLVRKQQGITSIRPIEEPNELRLVKNELGHRNVDFYGYDCVVFTEGDTEDIVLPLVANSMGYDLIQKGIKVTNIRGAGKVSKIEEYLRYLKDSDVTPFVVADGDKQVAKKVNDWISAGLLSKDNYKIWELEFEDCFGHERVVKAMKKLAEEHGFQFDLDAEQLKQRCSGKSVVKALSQWLHERHLPELDKPELGESLALILTEEIQKKETEREETEPERLIRKIVELLEPESAFLKDLDISVRKTIDGLFANFSYRFKKQQEHT